MSDSSSTETLILTMLNDLNKKVDAIVSSQVTRHEFEALGKRLDTLLVRAEFEAYKEAHQQWAVSESASIKMQLTTVVPRTELQAKWTEHDREIAELKAAGGSWKLTWPPILGGVVSPALLILAYLLHLVPFK